MRTIDIELQENGYPVYLGSGLLKDAALWQRHLGHGNILVVSNDVVAPLYLEQVRQSLGRPCETHILPDGEPMKTVATWSGILDSLVASQARRDATIVALGGGVVGDIAGFAAAAYMRGIRFVQAPTTLLAQVDASVGGKTAVNHERGKNLIGAFHQPSAVFIDTATLTTLAEREFRAGLAEVVKYGAIRDPDFFRWMEESAVPVIAREESALDYLIYRSVANKAEIVVEDEREAGMRALLNFGHSFGHALEAETAYQEFLHGEAVAIGMVTAARLSESRGLCARGSARRIAGLLERLGLATQIPAHTSMEGLARALNLDKKAVASGLRLILLESVGRAVIDDQSTDREILAAMQQSLAADAA